MSYEILLIRYMTNTNSQNSVVIFMVDDFIQNVAICLKLSVK